VTHPLRAAGARANLCFHDIADASPVIYTVSEAYLRAIAAGAREREIADRVRFYFDDGYASVIGATAILRAEYPEIEVVLALTLSFIGQHGFITWDDVRALHATGARIAAHGHQHLRMAELTPDQILFELSASRDALAGYDTDEFVLPYGSYNETVLTTNREHDLFSTITTVDYRWDNGEPLRPRLVVTTELSPEQVLSRLATRD
jgi:hypothetical protein